MDLLSITHLFYLKLPKTYKMMPLNTPINNALITVYALSEYFGFTPFMIDLMLFEEPFSNF
mgnify:CR=1 FL=1|jgi:hypothetical protein